MSFTGSVQKAVIDLQELRMYLDSLSLKEIHLRADKIIERFVPEEVIKAYNVVMKDLEGGEFE